MLAGVGFEHRGVNFRIRIGYLMADTVAKNDLMGMKGVGARNGCSHCRIEVSTSNKMSMSIKNNDYNLPFFCSRAFIATKRTTSSTQLLNLMPRIVHSQILMNSMTAYKSALHSLTFCRRYQLQSQST